ncbi:hypothetical protein JVU11DRAFT_7747 [Chiua virens]|nr:hypothetical protein JVU11DRAFT_7747 [Chiua virens]
MLMNHILDSSNSLRDLDDRSRTTKPLKRSASVASLPTPPRTHHKRSRSRARSFASHHDSDGSGSASELDDDLDGSYAPRIKRAKSNHLIQDMSDNDGQSEVESPNRKKRRTLGVLPGHDEEDEDENAFWTGRGSQSCGDKQEKKVAQADKTEETSPSPSPAMLRYRVKAPVSPPPSRRQPVIHPTRASSVERNDSSKGPSSVVPVTPPRRLFLRAPSPSVFKTPTKSQATEIRPKRDSPNNPFLVGSEEKVDVRSDWDSSDDEEVVGEARAREGTPTPRHEEKPTITYVFRGQKATFHNPLYGLAPEVVAASRLPIYHPDFEAAEACPPQRLFVSPGKRKSRDRSREGTSAEGVKRIRVRRSEDDCESSEDEQSGTRTKSREKPCADVETVASKAVREASSRLVDTEELQNAREARERRETVAKVRLAPKDGLRAGAIFTERDEPVRRAMGPLRSA